MYFVVNFVCFTPCAHSFVYWSHWVILSSSLYFKSCELIRYLAIAVMRWFPFIFKMYGSTHKDFFTNEYVRSLLELSISCLHRCVNILTIESLKESMNLFVFSMCCVSLDLAQLVQGQTEYASTSL